MRGGPEANVRGSPKHPEKWGTSHMNVTTSCRVTTGNEDGRGQEEGKDRAVEWVISRLNSVTLGG